MKLSKPVRVGSCLFGLTCLVVPALLGLRQMGRALDTPYRRLIRAVLHGDLKTVKAELDTGTDPNFVPVSEREPAAPLCAAAEQGDVSMVMLLLNRGADIHKGDPFHLCPLEAAATNNRLAAMELLVANGAGVNDDGKGGSSSLWCASMEGKVGAVRWLLTYGANPNTKDHEGKTLLTVIKANHLNAVTAELRKAGAK